LIAVDIRSKQVFHLNGLDITDFSGNNAHASFADHPDTQIKQVTPTNRPDLLASFSNATTSASITISGFRKSRQTQLRSVLSESGSG